MARFGVALVIALAAVGAGASTAQGAFGLAGFDGAISTETGDAYRQAGGHPNSASVTLRLNRTTRGDGFVVADGGDLRNAEVKLPPGLIGNPNAMPKCPKNLDLPSDEALNSNAADFEPNRFCPVNTIIGTADVTVSWSDTRVVRLIGPVFNLEPPPGVPAQFGFVFANQKAILDARIRSDGDYGIDVVTRNVNQARPVLASTVTLWGVPADHSHDNERCLGYTSPDFPAEGDPPVGCDLNPFTAILAPWKAPHAAGVKPQAFLTNSTACTPPGVGLETRGLVESWNPLAAADEASFISHLPPGLPSPPEDWGAPVGPEACDKVPFNPTVETKADSKQPDSPTGLTVDLTFPQDGLSNPTGTATAHLKRATVTLPQGWSVSPPSADGLVGCSDAQSSVGTLLGAQCPEASRIGTVEATTPLLEEKLEGGVYVGTQNSDDPQSGQMFRMFIALNNEERGVQVKLLGQIRVDPTTGRIETTFDNNPQVPVSGISLRLRGGPRAPLATPLDCGTKSVSAVLESWSGAVVTRTSDLDVNCPGVGRLAPSVDAGLTNNVAGAHSSFVLRALRPDGQQVMNGLALRMPDGLLATLKGVPRCSDVAANAGTCPEGSRVGTATVGAGPGAHPFFLQGGVYLTGPYKKGPFGLAVAVPAKAGPFDLGMVVVRQQLIVDPIDAHVDVVSDPLPTIVKGVPVRLRALKVSIDRSDFVLNPTSCARKSILAAFGAPDGSVFNTSTPLGVVNCAALPLKPKLKLTLAGKSQTTAGKHPGVKAVLTQRRGDANLKRVQVKLPLSLALDPENAQALCDFKDGTKVDPTCPRGSIVGRARAVTPILAKPLTAPVYFVKNVRTDKRTGRQIRTLPMLVIPLRGENGLKLNLKGESSVSRDNELVNTFSAIPDAPVTRFDLTIKGGRNGILAANSDICHRKQIAKVQIDGQNNKPADRRTTIATSACKKAKKGRGGRGGNR